MLSCSCTKISSTRPQSDFKTYMIIRQRAWPPDLVLLRLESRLSFWLQWAPIQSKWLWFDPASTPQIHQPAPTRRSPTQVPSVSRSWFYVLCYVLTATVYQEIFQSRANKPNPGGDGCPNVLLPTIIFFGPEKFKIMHKEGSLSDLQIFFTLLWIEFAIKVPSMIAL